MATHTKFHQYIEDLHHKVHNFSSDQLMVSLSNTLPVVGNSVLADITQIAYTNCSSRLITTLSSGQTAGAYKLDLQDLIISASGGAIATFRYIVVYNDAPASPLDPLIGFVDYGSALDLADGESVNIDFDNASGAITGS